MLNQESRNERKFSGQGNGLSKYVDQIDWLTKDFPSKIS